MPGPTAPILGPTAPIPADLPQGMAAMVGAVRTGVCGYVSN